MIKRMTCPSCGTLLDNDALWGDFPEGFQCVKCDKDFDENGEDIFLGNDKGDTITIKERKKLNGHSTL